VNHYLKIAAVVLVTLYVVNSVQPLRSLVKN